MDLKKLFEGKEGQIARHLGITIQAVSQWVAKGRVPPERAVPVACFLNLPNKLALLSPESTEDVNNLLRNGDQTAAVGRGQDGDEEMDTDKIYKQFGRLELTIEQLAKRVDDLAAAMAKRHPRRGRRR